MPATAYAAKGLLTQAIRDADPVLFCEPLRGYRLIRDEVPEEDYAVPFGQARMAREGTDIVVVAWSAAVVVAQQAADLAAQEGYSVAVLDLQTLVPLDTDGLRDAVAGCGRALVVHEAPATAGFGAEVMATIQEEAFWSLEAPIRRVTAYDTPYPLRRSKIDMYRPPSAWWTRSAPSWSRPPRAMARIEFQLPDVGEGVDAADVLEWRVAEGEAVREHEPLVEVQTDKATVEIPAPVTGTLVRRGVAAGDSVAVGGLLAVLESEQPEGPGRDREEPTRDRETRPTGAEPGRRGRAGPEAGWRGQTGTEPGRRGRATAGGAHHTSPGAGFRRRPGRHHGKRAPRTNPARGRRARGCGQAHGRRRDGTCGGAVARPTGHHGAGSRRGRGRPAWLDAALDLARAHQPWQTVPHVTDYREVDATALLAIRNRLRDQARRRGQEASAGADPTPGRQDRAVALAAHLYVNASIDMTREQMALHGRRSIGRDVTVPGPGRAGGPHPPLLDRRDRARDHRLTEPPRIMTASRGCRRRHVHGQQLRGPGHLAGHTDRQTAPGATRRRSGARPGRGHRWRAGGATTIALAVSGDHRLLDGHTLAAFVTDAVRLIEAPDLLLGQPARWSSARSPSRSTAGDRRGSRGLHGRVARATGPPGDARRI